MAWWRNWIIYAVLVLVGLGSFLTAYYLYTLPPGDSDPFRQEAAKASLTLAVGVVIGGFVKLLFSAHEQERVARQEYSGFLHESLATIKSVHDRIEVSRLLIRAHRSAKTYGEQMRDVVAASVALLAVKRAIELRHRTSTKKEQILDRLRSMLGYLQVLGGEYEEKYKPVAQQQTYDEQRKKHIFSEAAKRNEGELPDTHDQAWLKLKDPACFKALNDFLDNGDIYRSYFIEPYEWIGQTIGSRLTRDNVPGSGGDAIADYARKIKRDLKRVRET